jgi:hypothetical protein
MTRAPGRSALALTALVAAAFFLDPDRPLPIDLCIFHQWTGLPCPFCGLTRAFCHALHGHWAQSLACHLAGIPLAVGAAARSIWWGLEAACGRPLQPAWHQWAMRWVLPAGATLSILGWLSRLSGA